MQLNATFTLINDAKLFYVNDLDIKIVISNVKDYLIICLYNYNDYKKLNGKREHYYSKIDNRVNSISLAVSKIRLLKEDNVLYISKTDDIQKAFREVAIELARIGMEESNNPELDNFKCKCTAYMLCKKYGVEVSSIDINTIPDSLKTMSASEIRNELTSMRSSMSDINSRMTQHFEKVSKQKSREHER